MAKSVYVCDQDADLAIKTMMAAVVGTAVVPAHVNWALTASAMGAGAVAIGKCYGVQLTKDEGWKFVKQFILSAGMWFLSMNVSSKILYNPQNEMLPFHKTKCSETQNEASSL